MRVAITGASGFVGSHLSESLLLHEHEVVAMDQRPPNRGDADEQPHFTFYAGDVRDASYVRDGVAGCDLIFHLAAVVGVSKYMSDPFDVLDVNITGTRNVLDAASEAGTRLVLSSTSEVFGKNPKVPWSEDDDRVLGSTTIDRWSYSTSKAACEHLALAVHRQRSLPVTIVRYFNAYGPRQVPNYAASRAIHRVLNGLPPIVYDSGAQTRCFTYISDIVDGTMAAATTDEAVGEVFNIGSSTETTIKELTEMILALTGSDLGWQEFSTIEEYGSGYQDIDRRVPDTSKAAEILGWRATIGLEEGLRRTIEWAKAHPDWLAGPEPITESAPTTKESSE